MKFKITIDTYIYGGGHVVRIEEYPEGMSHFFKELTTDPCLIEAEFNKNKKLFIGKVQSNELTKYLREGVAFIKRDGEKLVYGLGHGGLLGGLDKEVTVEPLETCGVK